MIYHSSIRAMVGLRASALATTTRSLHSSCRALAYKKPASIQGRANTVIGAGTLGRRIALMWLTQGQPVHLL